MSDSFAAKPCSQACAKICLRNTRTAGRYFTIQTRQEHKTSILLSMTEQHGVMNWGPKKGAIEMFTLPQM
jgi:hypothetical protein